MKIDFKFFALIKGFIAYVSSYVELVTNKKRNSEQ